MAKNRLVAHVDESIIAKGAELAAIGGISFDEAIEIMIGAFPMTPEVKKSAEKYAAKSAPKKSASKK